MSTQDIELRFGQDGSVIKAFTKFNLKERFSDPLDSLEFEAMPPFAKIQEYNERLQKGELCAVVVNGNPQASLMIETVETNIGAEGVAFSVHAASPLKLMYEGGIDPSVSKSLDADVPISELILEAAAPFGLSGLSADADLADIRSKSGKGAKFAPVPVESLKANMAKAQPNESAYQFISRICTRLGVMVRLDAATGQLLLTRPHYDGQPIYTLVQSVEGTTPPKGDHFFGDIRIVDTNEGQYSFCELDGQAPDNDDEPKAAKPVARVLSSDLNPTRPPFRGGAATGYKPLFRRDRECRDIKRALSTATLALGLRAESAFTISGTVDGFVSKTGAIWTVDTLVKMFIGVLGFEEDMWISERTLKLDSKGAARTDVTAIPRGNFRLGEA